LLEYYGTIDIGSTNCKIGIFSENGDLIHRDDQPLISVSKNGKEEIDPSEIWKAVSAMLGRMPETTKKQMATLCLIGQGPTIIPVKISGEPLYNAISWLDDRGKERIPIFMDQGIDPQLAAGLSKLEWLRKELTEPAILLQPADYIAYQLSGKMVNMSFPYAGYLPWSQESLDQSGLSADFRIPELVETGHPLSSLSPETVARFGLSPKTLLVSGAPDFVAALVGTGTVEEGFLCDRGGSSQGVTLCTETKAFPSGLMTTPFFLPGLWKISSIMNTTGISLEWFCSKVARQPFGPSLEKAATVDRPSKILFLPYLNGERCPHWDSHAKGIFWGLSLESDADRMIVAILESVGFAMADAIERMEQTRCSIKTIRTTGKQALSPLWTQIKSDILGKPIAVPHIQESELWGGALLAMKERTRKDLPSLCRDKVRIDHTFYPDRRKNEVYKELLSIFQSLYAVNKPLFASFREIEERRRDRTRQKGEKRCRF